MPAFARPVATLALLSLMAAPMVAAPVAGAQALRSTVTGEPPAQSDSIYRLAVAPENHPEESSMLLLDDGVVRIESDGRTSKTYRQVVQILKEDAIEDMQEQSFSYAPGHQKLQVNWIRVVKPDGTIVSAKPTQMQTSDVPASMGDPVYADTKVIRASLSGVAVGTLVDWSYTIDELKPPRPGDFDVWWGIRSGAAVARSHYVVDAPAALHLNVKERNVGFARTEKVVNGRRILTWAANDVARVKGEPFASDSNTIFSSVAITAPTTWHDVGAWYAGLARNRYTLGAAGIAKVKALVASAHTRADTIRAIHKWVAQDIRYVSIDFGTGGYQPRLPDTTVVTGFGDCKDKATLFVAALADVGITAYPVLLNSSADIDRTQPTMAVFDHVIAAVPNEGGYTFTDLTADLVPFGELPYSEQGHFGLVVHPNGETEEITFSRVADTANYSHDIVRGSLANDGTLDLHYVTEMGGAAAVASRQLFMVPLDTVKRGELTRALAGSLYTGATGDSLVTFAGKDLSATPRFSIHLRRSQAITHSGGTDILTLPIRSPRAMVNLANQLDAMPPRQFPIDAAAVVGPVMTSTDIRIVLPSGWNARLPKSVHADSPFGSYVSEYEQTGRELHIVRRLTGKRGTLPPDQMKAMVTWMRAVGADDAEFVVLDHPVAPQ